MQEMILEVTKREGGKINLSIAQVSEVVAIVCDMVHENPALFDLMQLKGEVRAEKK